MKASLLLVSLMFVSAIIFGQENPTEIKGVVKDDKGVVLRDITVTEKGTTNVAVTNASGEFKINVKVANATLVFSGVGFQTTEVKAEEGKTISIVLNTDVKELSDVVVVGFGTQKKANLTGATSTVKMDQILGERPVSTTQSLLQGVAPGLQVTIGSGRPGEGANMNIRGATGFSGNSFSQAGPLILVDNTVFDGPVNLIDPNEIESVTVLKDAGSAAIYGARSAFGVILINTKKGKKNQKTQFNYSNNIVFANPTNLPEKATSLQGIQALLDGGMTTYNVGQGQSLSTWKSLIEEYNANPGKYPTGYTYNNGIFYQLKGADAVDELLGHSAMQFMNNLSISGGSDKTTYRLSFGSTNEKGILLDASQDKFNRYNVRTIVTSDIAPWFNAQLDAAYNYGFTVRPGYSNAYNYSARIPSYLRTDTIPGYAGLIATGKNLIETTAPRNYRYDQLRLTARAIVKPVKDVTITGEYTFSNYHNLETHYDKLTYLRDPYGWAVQPFGSNVYRKDNELTDYNIVNLFANYQKKFDRHNISVMGGVNQEFRNSESNWVSKSQLINTDVPSISTASGTVDGSDNYSQFATRGFFGRINYDFSGKYLLELNGRYDGSSRFPEGHRWGFFPSASIGWRVTEENFMQWVKPYVSEFKLRASLGNVGNQNIAEYQYIATMSPYNPAWLNNGSTVVTETTPGLISPDFTWETVQTLDFGASFGFLKNRLTGDFDWYTRDTKGILSSSNQPVPGVIGTPAPLTNSASVQTKGWEVELNWRDRVGKVGYYVSANLYDFTSTVTKVDNNPNKLLSSLYIGQKMGEIWGYTTDRFYTEADFVEGSLNADLKNGTLKPGVPRYGTQNPNPGDIMYRDFDGNGVVNAGKGTLDSTGDRRIIGNSTLRYQFGLRGGVTFKGFDFSFVIAGVGKQDQFRNNQLIFPNNFQVYGSLYSHQTDYWTKGKTDAYYGRIYTETPNGTAQTFNEITQTKFLLDGSYLRVRNLALRYSLPQEWVKKIHFQNISVNYNIENPFTFHHLPNGLFPDVADLGAGLGYPFMRKSSVGVNLTF
ncbi:MAG TPA: TonB-dependent receptor [Chitinophagaceae bacterium]